MAEVSAGHPDEVRDQLSRQRLVETKAFPHERVIRRISVIPGQRENRISRRKANQEEANHYDAEHGGHYLQQSPDDELALHSLHSAMAAK